MGNYRILKYVSWAALCPYIILCFFNSPSYDDFTYTVSALGKSFLEAQVFWYTTWSGRYTATALLTHNPLVYNWLYGYKFLSLGIILALLTTIHLLVTAYLGQLHRSERWLVTTFFTTLYLSLLPHLSGGIYWMAGSLTHAVPTVLAGLSIALIKRKGTSYLLDYLLQPLITFLIAGCNETIMLIWLVLLLLVNIYSLLKHKKIDPLFALLFIVAAAGSIIVFSAPGNVVRGGSFRNAHRPFFAITNSLAYTFIYMAAFGSVPFGLFLVWVVRNARKIQERLNWNWISRSSLARTFAVFCAVQFCTFFPALWSMGGKPPKYVYNMTIFFYIPLSVLTLLQLAIIFPDKFRLLEKVNLEGKKMVFAFCVIFLLLGNNGRAIYDILWDAPRYSAQLRERHEIIMNSAGQEAVVEELRNKPKSIFYSDIEDDPADFKNQQYARYFHLKSVAKKRSHE